MKTPRFGVWFLLFVLTLPAHGDVAVTTIVAFTNETPSTLVQGSDGDFYGTTWLLPSGLAGRVFAMSPKGGLRTVATFPAGSAAPGSLMQRKNDGNFYGWMFTSPTSVAAVLFMLTTNGIFTTLSTFPSGVYLIEPFIEGPDSYLYGTWASGDNAGAVFRFDGQFTDLHEFDGAPGSAPATGLTLGIDGNFYGSTGFTIFRIGTAGEFAILHTFTNTAGASHLLRGQDENLYGTSHGNVFKIDPATGAYTTLSLDGYRGGLWGPLAQGADGSIYGLASDTLFQITPAGSLTFLWIDQLLRSPRGLMLGSDGSLYGVTDLTIFRLTITPPAPFAFLPPKITNGLLTLTWNSAWGRAYQIQSATSLAPANWTNWGNSVTPTSRTTTVLKLLGPGAQFYRIIASP